MKKRGVSKGDSPDSRDGLMKDAVTDCSHADGSRVTLQTVFFLNKPMDHTSSFACREVTERVIIVMRIAHFGATVIFLVHSGVSHAGYMLQDVSGRYSLHGYTCRTLLLRTFLTS